MSVVPLDHACVGMAEVRRDHRRRCPGLQQGAWRVDRAAAPAVQAPCWHDLRDDPCRARAKLRKRPRASRNRGRIDGPHSAQGEGEHHSRPRDVGLRTVLSRHPSARVERATGFAAWHNCSPKFASIRPFGIGRRMGRIDGVPSTMLRFLLDSVTNGGLPLRQRVLLVELPKVQACARGIVMDNPRDTSLGDRRASDRDSRLRRNLLSAFCAEANRRRRPAPLIE